MALGWQGRQDYLAAIRTPDQVLMYRSRGELVEEAVPVGGGYEGLRG
jgi:hypothetical protein